MKEQRWVSEKEVEAMTGRKLPTLRNMALNNSQLTLQGHE